MSVWGLLQLLFNIGLALTVWVMWMKLRRPPKEDPRLSKGLQLLQSKIAVLEDLSDKTEIQFKQLTALLDKKCREVNTKIQLSEKQLQKIDVSMQKSMDVAKIFQDKIPHDEIIERQKTIKYVHAARLAHNGRSAQEIAAEIDLPIAEVSMILKINRNELQFDNEKLPPWVDQKRAEKTNIENSLVDKAQEAVASFEQEADDEIDFESVESNAHKNQKELEDLGNRFRQAMPLDRQEPENQIRELAATELQRPSQEPHEEERFVLSEAEFTDNL